MIESIVLKNIVTGDELPIAREETPNYILNYVDWGSVQGAQYTYKFTNQIGVYVANTTLETRPVTIVGWMIARSEEEMTIHKAKLNLMVNPQEELMLQYKNKYLLFNPETSIKYSRETHRENNEVIAQFKITGTAANPLFLDMDKSGITSGSYDPLFHFPLIINKDDIKESDDVMQHHPQPTIVFGMKKTSRLIMITNKGTVATGLLITIRAVNGAVVNPSVRNIETQEYFKINKELQADEVIEIETSIGSKHVWGKSGAPGSEWENYFKYRDYDSTWLQLKQGDSIFQYDADEGNGYMEVSIEFRNGYLEVEECY